MATIVFDLDGTLVDSGPDLRDTTNAILEANGLAPVQLSDLGHLVGQGGRAMLQRSFAMRGHELTNERLDALTADFLRIYTEHIPGSTKPFDGVPETLDALRSTGHDLAVCTNKFEGLSVRLLEALGMRDIFGAICGADTFDVRKPDPGHLLQTIERVGGDAQRSIMVGDSINDIEAARRADVLSIGVTFGYTSTPMAELDPTVIVESFAEIDEALVRNLLSLRS